MHYLSWIAHRLREFELARKFPQASVTFLNKVTGDNHRATNTGNLASCLKVVEEVWPEAQKAPEFIRLKKMLIS